MVAARSSPLLGAVLLGYTIALLGLVLMGIGSWGVSRAQHAEWEAAAGTVLESRMDKAWVRGGDGHWRWEYRPVVVYEYVVGGETYRGDRISAFNLLEGDRYFDEYTASAVLDRYPLGKQVVVYCDADDPTVAALDVSGSASWFLVGMGVFLLVPGLAVGAVFQGRLRRERRAAA